MTAPNGSILFNNSTGSDTTASGLGAANVYGSGASTTGASAVVTGIDTTGVLSGDLLWVQSSSGRQFSIIATVDSSTQVTCDDTFANTESGRTWAIGGKRATWDNSLPVFSDAKAGWIIETETDQSITSSIIIPSTVVGDPLNQVVIKGSDPLSKKIITQTNNNYLFNCSGQYITYRDMEVRYSHGTKNRAAFIFGQNRIRSVVNVDATHPTDYFQMFATRGGQAPSVAFVNCRIENLDYGISFTDGSVSVVECLISNITNDGIGHVVNADEFNLINSIVTGCGGDGVKCDRSARICCGNIFHSNGGDGFNGGSATSANVIMNNLFVDNTGFGIVLSTTTQHQASDQNAFYNNTLGDRSNVSAGANDITLTADPFVDAANGDFNLNADAGGGATLRANNYALNTDTSVYPFRQYVSDPFGGGGGNVIVIED
jgi:hypothetical protein